MRQQLHMIDWMQGLFAFQLDRNRILDHDVRPKATIEFDVAVVKGYSFLPVDFQCGERQFVCKAGLICGLKKTRSKPAMDFDCGANDSAGEFVDCSWGSWEGSGNHCGHERKPRLIAPMSSVTSVTRTLWKSVLFLRIFCGRAERAEQ